MKGHFQQYLFEDLDAQQGPGTHVYAHYGCDGVHHVIKLSEVLIEEDGVVVPEGDMRHEQLGLCDGSCGKTIAEHGGAGFMYEYDYSIG